MNEVSVVVGSGAVSLRNWSPMFSRQRTSLIFKGLLDISIPEDAIMSQNDSYQLRSDVASCPRRRHYLKEEI